MKKLVGWDFQEREPEAWKYISKMALEPTTLRRLIKEVISCTPASMRAKTIYDCLTSAYHEYAEEFPTTMK